MDELKALLQLAETNVGSFFVVALIFVLRYQDRRETRQVQVIAQDDKKEQALIDLLTGFLSGFKDMTDRFAGLQESINTTMTRIADYIKSHDDRSALVSRELNTALTSFGANVKINETKIDAIPDKVVTLMSSELDKLKVELPPLLVNGVKSEIDQLRADYVDSHQRLMVLIDELKTAWSAQIVEALRVQTEISQPILTRLEALTASLPQPPPPEVKPIEVKPDVQS